MANLIIQERCFRGVTIVDLSGKITAGETGSQLNRSLQRLVHEGKLQIIFNLANVTRVDSSGAAELIAMHGEMRACGGDLKLVRLPQRVTDLMSFTKLYTVFEVFDEEIDGVYSFDVPAKAAPQVADQALISPDRSQVPVVTSSAGGGHGIQ